MDKVEIIKAKGKITISNDRGENVEIDSPELLVIKKPGSKKGE